LPVKTPIEEIRDMFAKHGELGRVVLPPNGVTGLVEFYEPSEAKSAFRRLAYTKYKGAPLYLEWAPEGSFKPRDRPEVVTSSSNSIEQEQKTQSDTIDITPEDNAILFVKNLNFDSVDEELKTHVEKVIGNNSVCSATISRKKNPKKSGETLSMGYGFVQFFKSSDAEKALKLLQGKRLREHCLEFKRSNRASNASESKESTPGNKTLQLGSTTKSVVRNVPFEANAKEVEEIFKTFGSLKSVRLPKKITGSHRGFAFVDFHSKEEAKKAYEALCHSTHLYGRRLVLEWAEEEDTIEDLRRKTAHSFVGNSDNNSQNGPPSKRAKTKSAIVESLQTL